MGFQGGRGFFAFFLFFALRAAAFFARYAHLRGRREAIFLNAADCINKSFAQPCDFKRVSTSIGSGDFFMQRDLNLETRFIMNIGNETIFVDQEPAKAPYVKLMGRQVIKPGKLEPGQIGELPNYYPVFTTKSGKDAHVIHGNSAEAVRELNIKRKHDTHNLLKQQTVEKI